MAEEKEKGWFARAKFWRTFWGKNDADDKTPLLQQWFPFKWLWGNPVKSFTILSILFGVPFGAAMGGAVGWLTAVFLTYRLGIVIGVAWGVFMTILYYVAFYAQSFKVIPADPLSVGLVTFLRAPVNDVRFPGDRFLPWWGLLFDVLLYDSQEKNEQIDGIECRTPDNVGFTVGAAYTYVVDTSAEPIERDRTGRPPIGNKAHAHVNNMTPEMEEKLKLSQIENIMPVFAFHQAGKHDGVKRRLDDGLRTAIIEFMADERVGPKTYKEAQSLDNGIYANLLEKVAGCEVLPVIPSRVDTDILRKFFLIDKLPYTEEQSERIRLGEFTSDKDTRKEKVFVDAHQQGKPEPDQYPSRQQLDALVRKQVDKDNSSNRYHSVMLAAKKPDGKNFGRTDYEEFVQFRIEERDVVLDNLRTGQASIRITALGIKLLRIDILDRIIDPKVVAAAALEVEEELQARSEKVEQETVRNAIKELMKSPDDGGIGATLEQAMQIVQSERTFKNPDERSKVPVTKTQFGLDPATLSVIAGIMAHFGIKMMTEPAKPKNNKKKKNNQPPTDPSQGQTS